MAAHKKSEVSWSKAAIWRWSLWPGKNSEVRRPGASDVITRSPSGRLPIRKGQGLAGRRCHKKGQELPCPCNYALIRPLLLLPQKIAVKIWPGSVLLKHIYFQRPWLLWERRQASAPRKGTPASQRAQNGNAGKPARPKGNAGKPARPKRERRQASAPKKRERR